MTTAPIGPPIGPPIGAVCFDLDDTLYPQAAWLDGAWEAVADAAERRGVERSSFLAALHAIAATGSDGGRIIDRALEAISADGVPVEPLVTAFRTHAPARLAPYPGVTARLDELAARVPLGLVSDGDPRIQTAKLDALGLATRFAVVVWSDEHGREHRKPDPLPFRLAVDALGLEPAAVVYVGDRPAKDVAGACAAGLRAIRVRTGEWASARDDPRAAASFADVVGAIDAILNDLATGRGA